MVPFWLVLFVIGLVALAAGSIRSGIAAFVLLVNWCLCAAYTKVTGDGYNPLVLGTIDLVSGCAILMLPFGTSRASNKSQVIVAATYLALLGWHGWYECGIQGVADRYYYWHAMSKIAWLQAWLVIGWTGIVIREMARDGRYPLHRVLVRKAVHRKMGADK